MRLLIAPRMQRKSGTALPPTCMRMSIIIYM